MAEPTAAECRTQINNAVEIDSGLRVYSVDTFISDEDDLTQSLEGDWSRDFLDASDGVRASLAGSLSNAGVAALITPGFKAYGKNLDFPEQSLTDIVRRLYDYMVANSEDVETRDFTFGSPSAGGSNVGDGVVHRLTVDKNALDIENQHADSKTFECTNDEHSGASEQGAEVFEFRGSALERPPGLIVQDVNSGLVESVTGLVGRDSLAYIQNPSFSRATGTPGASGWLLTGWTFGGTDTDWTTLTGAANIYRTYRGEGTATSLKLSASDSIEQNLSVKRAQFNPDVPVFLQVAWNGTLGSAVDGNLVLTLGSQTATVAVAQTGWQVLYIAIGQKLWFDTWNQEDPLVKIEWTSRTSGFLVLDDVIFSPMRQFDGAWYAILGGQTPFLKDDIFTLADTEVGSKVQRAVVRATNYSQYLPHDGSPTWTDPT